MAGCSGGCQRDYWVIALDVLELAAQTPDRDLAESLRQLLMHTALSFAAKSLHQLHRLTIMAHLNGRQTPGSECLGSPKERCRRSQPQRSSPRDRSRIVAMPATNRPDAQVHTAVCHLRRLPLIERIGRDDAPSPSKADLTSRMLLLSGLGH